MRIHILPVRNRRYRAVRTADLAPGETPLPAAQSWAVLERELLHPTHLPALQQFCHAIAGSMRIAALRHAFQSGAWALLPPTLDTTSVQRPAPEPLATQLRIAKPVKTWVEMEVVDEQGRPQPNHPYLCMLPDGRLETGVLDSRGRVRFDGIDPGNCVFSLTALDQETWAKAS